MAWLPYLETNMQMRIVYEKALGGVAIIIPNEAYVAELIASGKTELEACTFIADKDVPDGISYSIVPNDYVPADRSGRASWTLNTFTTSQNVIHTVKETAAIGAYNIIVDSNEDLWIGGNTNPGYVHKISSAGVVLAKIDAGNNVLGLAEVDGYIWITEMKSNTISQIDMATNTLVHTMSVGVDPYALAYTGGFLYAAIQGDNQILKINPVTKTVIATLDCGTAPHNMTVNGPR